LRNYVSKDYEPRHSIPRVFVALLTAVLIPACGGGSDSNNLPPAANDQSLSTAEDTPVPVVLTGSDPEGGSLSYSVSQPPLHGNLSGTAPNLTYTPDTNFNGADQFTFVVNDGISSSSAATIALTISPVNDAPVASPQVVTTLEDTPIAIVLAGTDVDGNSLTFLVLSGPANGTLSGTPPSLTYTPQSNFNGADSITFRASDGLLNSSSATVTINVTAVNDSPIAVQDVAETPVNTPITISVLVNDTDIEGDGLIVSSIVQPTHGVAVLNGGGTVTYTPSAAFMGTDTFSYSISDGHGGTSSATVLVGVGEFPKGLTLERVSISSAGVEGNGESGFSVSGDSTVAISSDGRFVAFESAASNLVPGDTGGVKDIFVRDRLTNQTTRVSISSGGTQGNGASFLPSISSDGRYVAFLSAASNLVPSDTNGVVDVFVHDRQTGVTERVSVSSGGVQTDLPILHAAISGDGRFVAFDSASSVLVAGDTNAVEDVFRHDRVTHVTTRVSVDYLGNQSPATCQNPLLSNDGRFVTFWSASTTLVPGDTTNGWDVFIRDTTAGTTTRISLASDGSEANQGVGAVTSPVSPTGRYVVFTSSSTNLSASDTNGQFDAFLRDTQLGTTVRVTVRTDGVEGNAGSGSDTSLSDDGRFVVFDSLATNLDLSGDMNSKFDVYLRDLQTGITTRMSVALNGTHGTQGSLMPKISANGHYIVFESRSDNLISGDANQVGDIFIVPNPFAP